MKQIMWYSCWEAERERKRSQTHDEALKRARNRSGKEVRVKTQHLSTLRSEKQLSAGRVHHFETTASQTHSKGQGETFLDKTKQKTTKSMHSLLVRYHQRRHHRRRRRATLLVIKPTQRLASWRLKLTLRFPNRESSHFGMGPESTLQPRRSV